MYRNNIGPIQLKRYTISITYMREIIKLCHPNTVIDISRHNRDICATVTITWMWGIPVSRSSGAWRPRSVGSRPDNSVKLSLNNGPIIMVMDDWSLWWDYWPLFSVDQSSWTIDPCLRWKTFDPLFYVDQSSIHFVDQQSAWINSLVFQRCEDEVNTRYGTNKINLKTSLIIWQWRQQQNHSNKFRLLCTTMKWKHFQFSTSKMLDDVHSYEADHIDIMFTNDFADEKVNRDKKTVV